MFDVISVGSATLDIFLKSRAFLLLRSKAVDGGIALCEAYEGKIEADEVEVVSGGGGTNSAVSFVRKRLRSGVIVELGKDIPGSVISAELLREGVDARYVVVEEGEETALSVILVSGEGGRTIVTYRGASRMLTHRDIPWSHLRTRWLYITSLGGRISLLEELVAFAKRKGILLAVNPGMAEIAYGKRLFARLKGIDVLILNREEAMRLTGINFLDNAVFRSEACLLGPRISVITAGSQGGKVCVDGGCRFFSAASARVVSTVGAGDAFGSGFVAALIHGKSIEVAIEWGRRNSASVVQHLSAKKGLLPLSELPDSASGAD